jgi:DNA-3-methyladenine glycosylase II
MSSTELNMKAIVADLAARDARMAEVIAAHPLCTLGTNAANSTHFESLVESVISQQVSVKAADTIFGRLKERSRFGVVAESIAELSEAEMRECGLSGSKTKTIKGLADASLSGLIDFESLHLVDDDEAVSTQLNSLWGIGPWTVDMFMMFRLGRLDIWPVGDLGVRRGWETIYALDEQIDPKALIEAGSLFRPYRSVVAWYCWREWD